MSFFSTYSNKLKYLHLEVLISQTYSCEHFDMISFIKLLVSAISLFRLRINE